MGVVLVILVLVVIGCFIASIFVRRHGETRRPEADWHRTDEVFHDPSTGRVMRVWLDASSERHYVAEDKGPAA